MNVVQLLRAHLAGGVLDSASLDLSVMETHIDKTDADAVKLFEHVVALTKARRQFDAVISELNAKYLA